MCTHTDGPQQGGLLQCGHCEVKTTPQIWHSARLAVFHAFSLPVPLTAFVSTSAVYHCSAHTCMYTYGIIPTLNACTTCPVVGVVLQYQLETLAYTGGKPCALKTAGASHWKVGKLPPASSWYQRSTRLSCMSHCIALWHA